MSFLAKSPSRTIRSPYTGKLSSYRLTPAKGNPLDIIPGLWWRRTVLIGSVISTTFFSFINIGVIIKAYYRRDIYVIVITLLAVITAILFVFFYSIDIYIQFKIA